jgi:hypothetical protein
MSHGARIARSSAGLTEDERKKLFAATKGMSLRESASLLKVGEITMQALLDPHGRVSPETAKKVRQRLEELSFPRGV